MLTPDDVLIIEPTACWNSVSGPFKPPGPATLNASFEGPTTRPPSPSGLDQPTRDNHNRRNCSVNRYRQCLKVVDRFRRATPAPARLTCVPGPKTLADLGDDARVLNRSVRLTLAPCRPRAHPL